jgi:dGTPase
LRESPRDERYKEKDRPRDQRRPSQRDRDRILNSSAFRRLAGVTQVVSAAEGEVFHNRLTHSLEVAQVGRRIAEHLVESQGQLAADLGGIDPEVVDAAGLSHDLGHPPFGHIAEEKLDALMTEVGSDGFEGNPQSFRILTVLAVRAEDLPGLNLTRATLNAVLKYPWLRDRADADKSRKWGAYVTESDLLAWVRSGSPEGQKSVEAAIMDWSDDIAYAVHDVEDFYRAGMLPLDRLSREDEVQGFIEGVVAEWDRAKAPHRFDPKVALKVLPGVLGYAPVVGPYSGTRAQRAALRHLTSNLVGRYVRALSLDASGVVIDPDIRIEVDILKELTWHYVIRNPALAAQQHGQQQVVRDLLGFFREATEQPASASIRRILPRSIGDALFELEVLGGTDVTKVMRLRFAADAVAGLTEQQALNLHSRLTGHDPRSVLDPIIR